ncbi:TRAP transporter small permease [Tropicibacter naphthalenivorans]|uniref:TRAP transporter small permease protein n=1 Tax=Tropicibacter naphthalenivorans TaxID=441103 RepID=A0A0P1GGU6_9RHOB|nr:TRAP transporter small permease [Tropicibacter naphthalenivorans]CUH80858.1 TRAP-type C4-dicarboxylate transport system, small permease component [Tropicibacter naphthalenivorans]SMC90695.1 TRAP-type C4-dicarboxylate transport system, small permease component [Tropicibacter naphthalenivorans]
MRHAEKVINAITFVAKLGTGLSFSVLIAAVLIQVVGRHTGMAPVWTEELTRYALLFTVAFGAGLAFRTGDLVNVDVICEHLPGKAPWLLRLFAALVTAGLAIYLLPHAWRYVSIGKMQTSPALGVRMDFIHAAVWIMLALIAVFGVLRILGMLTGTEDGKPQKPQED